MESRSQPPNHAWQTLTVGDRCYVTDGAHAKVARQASGVLYLTSKNIGVGELILRDVSFISSDDYERLFPMAGKAPRRPRAGDVLTGIIGTFGNAYVYKPTDHFGVSSAVAILRPDRDKLLPEYLYYVLTSSRFRATHAAFKSGSVQGYTNIPTIKSLPLICPPIEHQYAIASILTCLDQRIENLNHTNRTLEAIARAIFKSWFVDFDPVRAKAEGREPEGMDAATSALFPSRLENSELGEIPKGWAVQTLGEVADVVDCLHSKKPIRQESGRVLLQLWNITSNGTIDLSDPYLVTEADYEKWISRIEANEGDCVITNVGRIGAAAQIPAGCKAALGRNMTGLRCRPEFQGPTFLIELLTSDSMREEIALKTDSGTILDSLNVRSIPKLRFVCPSHEIISTYEAICRPLRARIELNISAAQTLVQLRDTLLPRLISGKLPVAEAKELVEAAL